MRHEFDIRETIARALPGKDPARADRFLRWLDLNGYTIVEKDAGQATLVPGLSEGNAAPQDKLVAER
jgi:hypothetical protein